MKSKNINIYVFTLFISIILSSFSAGEAKAYTLSILECQAISNDINSTAPQQIDYVTELKGTVCYKNASNEVSFNYIYNLLSNDFPHSGFTAQFKNNVVNTFCTDPEIRIFLDTLSEIKMTYYFKNSGKFYDQFAFSNKNCW